MKHVSIKANLCLLTTYICLSACSHHPSTHELMLNASQDSKQLAYQWKQGETLIASGEKLKIKGNKMRSKGESLVHDGNKTLAKGKSMSAQGSNLVNEGDAQILKGRNLQSVSQEEFKQKFPTSSEQEAY